VSDHKAQFSELVETMLARSDATYGADGSTQGARRTFGSTSLKANGKIFAMLVNERLVVKLPAARVDELAAAGAGERFDPGHGRVQRQWLSVASSVADDWLALAIEAESFVSRSGAARRPAPADRRPGP
jgi:TfoX/Sxy family transcriptional regulator of competence genes